MLPSIRFCYLHFSYSSASSPIFPVLPIHLYNYQVLYSYTSAISSPANLTSTVGKQRCIYMHLCYSQVLHPYVLLPSTLLTLSPLLLLSNPYVYVAPHHIVTPHTPLLLSGTPYTSARYFTHLNCSGYSLSLTPYASAIPKYSLSFCDPMQELRTHLLLPATAYTSEIPRYSLHLCLQRVLPSPLLYSQCTLHLCFSQALPTHLPLPETPYTSALSGIFASYGHSSHPCSQVLPMSSAPW